MPRETGNHVESTSKQVADASISGNAISIQDSREIDSIDIDLKARFEFSSTQFVDDGHEYHGQHEYKRSEDDQGLVLIFNQEKFDDITLRPRTGSIRDINNVMTTFAKLGFNVKKTNVHLDLDRAQILETISNLSAEEYRNKNSLVVIFMSHGNSQNVLYTRRGQITVDELVTPLAQYFENKPKLFIIQACKATQEDMRENSEIQLTFPIYTLPSDTVIYYSTVEGKVSVRHVIRGTWVIEELCKNFLMYGRKEDVLSLLQRTTKCVSILETELDDGLPYKQMPVTVSTLQGKFYLTANKFRRNIHFATQGVIQVTGELKELLQQFSSNGDYKLQ